MSLVTAAPTLQNCCPLSANEAGILNHYKEESYKYTQTEEERKDWLESVQDQIDREIESAKQYVVDCNKQYDSISSKYDLDAESTCNAVSSSLNSYTVTYDVLTKANPEEWFDYDEHKTNYEFCIGKTAFEDSYGLFGEKDPVETYYEKTNDKDLISFIDSKTYKTDCNSKLLENEAYKSCYTSNTVGNCFRTCYALYKEYEDMPSDVVLGSKEYNYYTNLEKKYNDCNNKCDSDIHGHSDYQKEMDDCMWEAYNKNTCWMHSYLDARKSLFIHACRNAYGEETDDFKFKYKFIYGEGNEDKLVPECSEGMQYNNETGNCDPIQGSKAGKISLSLSKNTFDYGTDKELEVTINYNCKPTDVDTCTGGYINLKTKAEDILGNIKFDIVYPKTRTLTNDLKSIKVKISPSSVKLGTIDLKDPIKIKIYQTGQENNAKEFTFNMPQLKIKSFDLRGKKPVDQNVWNQLKISIDGPKNANYFYVFKSVPGSRFRFDKTDYPFVALRNTKERDFTINWEAPMISKKISLEDVYTLIAADTAGKMGMKAANYLAGEHVKKSLNKITNLGKTPPITMKQFEAYDNVLKGANYAYTGLSQLPKQNKEWNRKKGEGEDWIYHQGKRTFAVVSAMEGFVGNFLPEKLNVPGTVLSIGLDAVGGWYKAVDATITVANSEMIKKEVPISVDVILSGYETQSKTINVTVQGEELLTK